MGCTPGGFDWEEWLDLRAIVLDAAQGDSSELIERHKGHPITQAVVAYLNERNEERLNAAAKALAKMKPGIDPAIIEREYWLILDKS